MPSLLERTDHPIRGRFQIYSLIAAAGTALPLFANVHVVFELLSHFRVQYAVVLILLAMAAVVLRLPKTAAWLAVAASYNAAFFASDLVSLFTHPRPVHASTGTEEHRLKIIAFNVFTSNTQVEAIQDFVRAEKPDVLLILELSPAFVTAFRPEDVGLKVVVMKPQDDNFGIGLYARSEPTTARLASFAGDHLPTVDASFKIGNSSIRLIGIHPLPPMSPQAVQRRDALALEAARTAVAGGGPAVLIGDFNMSPWTPAFSDLTALGLVDSRLGFGLQRSWPTNNWPLAIPIDHALVTREVRVIDRRVGPSLGSDHRPVILTVEVGR